MPLAQGRVYPTTPTPLQVGDDQPKHERLTRGEVVPLNAASIAGAHVFLALAEHGHRGHGSTTTITIPNLHPPCPSECAFDPNFGRRRTNRVRTPSPRSLPVAPYAALPRAPASASDPALPSPLNPRWPRARAGLAHLTHPSARRMRSLPSRLPIPVLRSRPSAERLRRRTETQVRGAHHEVHQLVSPHARRAALKERSDAHGLNPSHGDKPRHADGGDERAHFGSIASGFDGSATTAGFSFFIPRGTDRAACCCAMRTCAASWIICTA